MSVETHYLIALESGKRAAFVQGKPVEVVADTTKPLESHSAEPSQKATRRREVE